MWETASRRNSDGLKEKELPFALHHRWLWANRNPPRIRAPKGQPTLTGRPV